MVLLDGLLRRRFGRILALAAGQVLAPRVHLDGRRLSADPIGSWCLRCGCSLSRSCTWASAGAHPLRTANSDKRFVSPPCCPHCAGVLLGRVGTVRLGEHDGVLRDAVLSVKHARSKARAREIGRLLAVQWTSAVGAAACTDAVAIPIAMPLARRVERGIDHAFEIARHFSMGCGIPMVRALGQSAGLTQAALGGMDRRARLDRFWLRRWWDPDPIPSLVVLVDDVLTTGATAEAACRAIHSKLPGVPVAVVVATVAPRHKSIRDRQLQNNHQTTAGTADDSSSFL